MNVERLNFPVFQSCEIPDEVEIDVSDNRSDLELSEAASKSDMGAFEEIYKRHQLRVYDICLQMLPTTEQAEDLTQDVFLTLYRKISMYKGEVAFTAWLRRMTVDVVLLHFGKRTIGFAAVEGNGVAVYRLPEDFKRVYILCEVLGYDIESVADILGCSVGTIRARLYKAKKKLKKLIRRDINK
jgi:RNA polymerase sigma-70 factor, ECF subfamily